MYEGYKIMAKGLVDGGTDIFLLETCQDPLQIKAALHALNDTAPHIPIMVSVTIELSGTMLIGTDAMTIAAIMAPFNILSLGFNCGTGPKQVHKHVKTLSEVCNSNFSSCKWDFLKIEVEKLIIQCNQMSFKTYKRVFKNQWSFIFRWLLWNNT